jgi:hypothetical protein
MRAGSRRTESEQRYGLSALIEICSFQTPKCKEVASDIACTFKLCTRVADFASGRGEPKDFGGYAFNSGASASAVDNVTQLQVGPSYPHRYPTPSLRYAAHESFQILPVRLCALPPLAFYFNDSEHEFKYRAMIRLEHLDRA